MRVSTRQALLSRPLPRIPASARNNVVAWWDADQRPDIYFKMTNLVTNCQFNGLTGWNYTNCGTPVTSNGEVIFTPTAQYGSVRQNFTLKPGHKYYLRASVKTTCANMSIVLHDRATPYAVYASFNVTADGVYHTLSSLGTYTGDGMTTTTEIAMLANGTTGFGEIRVRDIMLIDLSTTFGFNNEFTQLETDDVIVSNGTASWNGMALVKCNPNSKYFWPDTVGKVTEKRGSVNQFITNGDFHNGTTGWLCGSSSHSVSSGILSNTGSLAAAYSADYQVTNMPYVASHLVYMACLARVTNTSCSNMTIDLRGTTTAGTTRALVIANPTQNVWYKFAGIVVVPSDGAGNLKITIAHTYADAATANGKVAQFQFIEAVDLTADYGIGAEPPNPYTVSEIFINEGYFEGARTVTMNPMEANQFGQGRHMRIYNAAYTPSDGWVQNPSAFLGEGVDTWLGRAEYGLIPVMKSYSICSMVAKSTAAFFSYGYGAKTGFATDPSVYRRYSGTGWVEGAYDYAIVSSPNALFNMTWDTTKFYSVVCTYDETTRKTRLYINGLFVSESTALPNGSMATNFYRMCRDSGGTGYQAYRDGIEGIFNRALTDKEIKDMYNGNCKRFGLQKAA